MTTIDSGFSAVVTTGIYCRDGCPATPLPENVQRFAFAAAAEAAGFRPCLRCRPYRGSEPAAWVGPSELVCRAVQMIVDGALDGDEGEADLARRLGVSNRHLRRLFAEHIGATPDAVARSRRAHFARRLLDDTDLPVTQVAFAAGFGSVRQMNRTMQRIFRASPVELRAKRRRADRLVADGGLDLRLPYRGPLDWDVMARFLGSRAIPGVEAVDARGYRRTVSVAGFPGVIELGPGAEPGWLVLRAHLPRWDGLIHLVARARRLFDLDADAVEIDATLAADPMLRERVRRHPGVRVPGCWDPFEFAVRAVLGQQVSVRSANTRAGRLVERLGRRVTGLDDLGLSHCFPEPAAIADADLTGLGMTRSREQAVREIARRVLEGALPLDGSEDLEATVDALTRVPGVGSWTAHVIALRACGIPDAFPASDLGLRRAAGNGAPLSPGALQARAEAWRPWRAYGAMRLWTGHRGRDERRR